LSVHRHQEGEPRKEIEMNKGKNAYYIAEWNKYNNWSEDYSMLKGPNGFECCLTEPEDRVWYRDGEGVIGELNRLHAELNKPITEHPDVQESERIINFCKKKWLDYIARKETKDE